MPDPLLYTQLEDGSVTIDNAPAPESIVIERVLWEQMVTGELDWAVVSEVPSEDPQFPQPIQVLTITASNVTATFKWLATGPGKSTVLDTTSWSNI